MFYNKLEMYIQLIEAEFSVKKLLIYVSTLQIPTTCHIYNEMRIEI